MTIARNISILAEGVSSSGILTIAAGGTGVTTSTGNGSVVLSTSPTLSTPLLGTPTSGNFSTGNFTWPTFNQSTSGNSATSTKLAAAVNINGVAFNGSADIIINAIDSTARVASSLLGINLGVATLDSSGKLTEIQIPSSLVGAVVGTTDTQTLTNKIITSRVKTTTSNAYYPALNTDDYDMWVITGQIAGISSFTTNLTGTPVNGQKLWVSIQGQTTIPIVTWGAMFESSTAILPTTTVGTLRLDVGFIYNSGTAKWRCVAVA